MRMKKSLFFLLMMFMVAVLLGACTANESAGEDPDQSNDKQKSETEEGTNADRGEKVLNLNNGVEPSSLDATIGFDEESCDPLNNLVEGLTRLGEDHMAQPGAAEEWDVSEDRL